VLEKIFGTKSEEITGHLTKLHNEKLHNLCSSAIIRMTTRMRWATHVAYMGDIRTVNTTLDENMTGNDHLLGQDVHGKITLIWILTFILLGWVVKFWCMVYKNVDL
jgi:hypothetical protein